MIGYLADLANDKKSSGNVLPEVVAPYDKIQLHIECFEAPSGRSSTGALKDIKDGCTLDDPTSRLRRLAINRSSVWSRELLRKPQTT